MAFVRSHTQKEVVDKLDQVLLLPRFKALVTLRVCPKLGIPKTRSGLAFEVLGTSESEPRAKSTSSNDLFAFDYGFCTPEW